MFDDHETCCSVQKVAGKPALPLFYRKKISAGGRIDELSVGPSVVSLVKWIVILVIGIILERFAPVEFLQFVLKHFP
jgi:hypothetical protein